MIVIAGKLSVDRLPYRIPDTLLIVKSMGIG
jgi:hypothetical protein